MYIIKKSFNYLDCLFIHISYYNNEITQVNIIELLSPTKCILLLNKYFCNSNKNTKSRKDKLCFYSDTSSLSAISFINKYLETIIKIKNFYDE